MALRQQWDVIIVGGGPAGAMMAYALAKGGVRVAIFDPSHPRHKPCSGFLNSRVFTLHPLLSHFQNWYLFEGKRIYTAPSGRSFTLSNHQALTDICICSRSIFDLYLIKSAQSAGADWFQEKVTAVNKQKNRWQVVTQTGTYYASIIVGADGVKSRVRKKISGPFVKNDLIVAMGNYYMGEKSDELHTVFIEKGGMGFFLPGYGFTQIIAGYRRTNTTDINKSLRFLVNCFPGKWHSPTCSWAALQPAPITKCFFQQKCSGEQFCLIGDAAGHCHPLRCEGIIYAIHGAMLASECVLKNRLAEFDTIWRDKYGLYFEKTASRISSLPVARTMNIVAWAFSQSDILKSLFVRSVQKVSSGRDL